MLLDHGQRATTHAWRAPALALAALACVCSLAGSAVAQFDLGSLNPQANGQVAAAPKAADLAEVAAVFTEPTADKPARLYIEVELDPGWHTYSLTQPEGGPLKSRINVELPEGFVLGEFAVAPEPNVHPEPAFENLEVEEHHDRFVWYAPLEVPPGTELADLQIEGTVSLQLCKDSCLPPTKFAFSAELGEPVPLENEPDDDSEQAQAAPPADLPGPPESFADGQESFAGASGNATFSGWLARTADGWQLTIAAETVEGWHIYPYAPIDPALVSKPTLLALAETADLQAGAWQASSQPVEHAAPATGDPPQLYHEGLVAWSTELSGVPAAGASRLAGILGYQTCSDEACDFPAAAWFEVPLPADPSDAGPWPVRFVAEQKYAIAARWAAYRAEQFAAGPSAAETTPPRETAPDAPLPTADPAPAPLQLADLKPQGAADGPVTTSYIFWVLGSAFLGGLILNVMPCVLPVIGLKVLSFVEQAGHSRRESFLLNLWYSLGLLSVFWGLAAVVVVWHVVKNQSFGWGQQLSYDPFNIALASVVFAMALSFLGVWEIPVPGFVGGAKANDLASREGYGGAFLKGIITTLLATPCTGPFLGSALAATARLGNSFLTFAVFTCVGLGMASPYLLAGSFPKLLKFLPKPGAWMETFKQAMGFMLLGTVVFLLSFIRWPLVVPTFGFLMGLWAALWWVGRTPLYAELGKKLFAWFSGSLVAACIGLLTFLWLRPVMEERFVVHVDREIADRLAGTPAENVALAPDAPAEDAGEHLPWQPFRMDVLQEHLAAGRTVLVDFTADWCQTCKFLEKTVLNTRRVREAVDANHVVTLVADMTRFPDEESALLESLTGGSRQVPVIAIFPAERPSQPLVLIDGYTQSTLLAKLAEAGPSLNAAANTADSDSAQQDEATARAPDPNDAAGVSSKPWAPFTMDALNGHLSAGRDVLVYFTADWCVNCKVLKVLKSTVLDSDDVQAALESKDIPTLLVDLTHDPDNPVIAALSHDAGLPVTAIFRAESPNEPQVIYGPYSRQTILEAIDAENSTAQFPWVEFNHASLQRFLDAGYPVMLFMVADWDIDGQRQLKLVVNTPQVHDYVARHGVVVMLANYTDNESEAFKFNMSIGYHSTATIIYPAGRADQPIHLPYDHGVDELLAALVQAGPPIEGIADHLSANSR